MGPSTLLPSESSFNYRLRTVDHRSQLERFGEIGIECRPMVVDTGVCVAGADPRDALLCRGEALCTADDRGLVHHQRLELLAKIGDALAFRPRKQISHLRPSYELGIDRQRRQVALLAELQHVPAGASSEDDQIDK